MAEGDLVLTPGRVESFVGKRELGGYKIYLTTPGGKWWVELGGRGIRGNPLRMEKQPNLGFQSEDDAWSFAERFLGNHPEVVKNPRGIFRLYSYAHPAEFYTSRSRPMRLAVPDAGLAQQTGHLFDETRQVSKYERPDRPNQAEFRAAVLHRYGTRCAFCRIAFSQLLDAAHVIAWNEQGADVPENGLVLCKLHHCALDAGLIRIDPTSLKLSCRCDPDDVRIEVGDILHLPTTPHPHALEWLWERTRA
jgi:hypothetical protein